MSSAGGAHFADRHGEQVADDLMADEEQSLGTVAGCEHLDVTLVLFERTPRDELPQRRDEVSAFARRVAEFEVGFDCSAVRIIDQVREQDLLAAVEQRRDEQRQVGVGARRPRSTGAAPQRPAASRSEAGLVKPGEPGFDDQAVTEQLAQLGRERVPVPSNDAQSFGVGPAAVTIGWASKSRTASTRSALARSLTALASVAPGAVTTSTGLWPCIVRAPVAGLDHGHVSGIGPLQAQLDAAVHKPTGVAVPIRCRRSQQLEEDGEGVG